MDEESLRSIERGTGPGKNHIVDCPNRWASVGWSLLFAVGLVACEVVPDRIGVGAGHTFNRGSHLATTARESGSSLRNEDNGDSQSLFVYAEYDLKPMRVELLPREIEFYERVGHPLAVQDVYPKPAEVFLEPRTEPLPPNPPEADEQDVVNQHLDTAERVVDIAEDTSWDAFWRIIIAVLVVISGVGLYFFITRRRAKKKK